MKNDLMIGVLLVVASFRGGHPTTQTGGFHSFFLVTFCGYHPLSLVVAPTDLMMATSSPPPAQWANSLPYNEQRIPGAPIASVALGRRSSPLLARGPSIAPGGRPNPSNVSSAVSVHPSFARSSPFAAVAGGGLSPLTSHQSTLLAHDDTTQSRRRSVLPVCSSPLFSDRSALPGLSVTSNNNSNNRQPLHRVASGGASSASHLHMSSAGAPSLITGTACPSESIDADRRLAYLGTCEAASAAVSQAERAKWLSSAFSTGRAAGQSLTGLPVVTKPGVVGGAGPILFWLADDSIHFANVFSPTTSSIYHVVSNTAISGASMAAIADDQIQSSGDSDDDAENDDDHMQTATSQRCRRFVTVSLVSSHDALKMIMLDAALPSDPAGNLGAVGEMGSTAAIRTLGVCSGPAASGLHMPTRLGSPAVAAGGRTVTCCWICLRRVEAASETQEASPDTCLVVGTWHREDRHAADGEEKDSARPPYRWTGTLATKVLPCTRSALLAASPPLVSAAVRAVASGLHVAWSACSALGKWATTTAAPTPAATLPGGLRATAVATTAPVLATCVDVVDVAMLPWPSSDLFLTLASNGSLRVFRVRTGTSSRDADRAATTFSADAYLEPMPASTRVQGAASVVRLVVAPAPRSPSSSLRVTYFGVAVVRADGSRVFVDVASDGKSLRVASKEGKPPPRSAHFSAQMQCRADVVDAGSGMMILSNPSTNETVTCFPCARIFSGVPSCPIADVADHPMSRGNSDGEASRNAASVVERVSSLPSRSADDRFVVAWVAPDLFADNTETS